MQLNVQKIETVIQKINFLFKSIKKSDELSQHLEVALLKQYAINLYDAILESEQNLPSVKNFPEKGNLGDGLSETSMLAVEKLKIAEEKKELKAVDFEKETPSEPIKLKKVKPVEKEKVVEEVNDLQVEIPSDDLNPTDDMTDVITENLEEEPMGIKIVGDVEQELAPVETIEEETTNWIEEVKSDTEDFYDDSKTEVLSKFSSMGIGENVGEQVVEEITEKPKLELNDVLAQNKEETNLAEKLGNEVAGNSFNISVNQRFAFVQQLFAGDAEAYETTLHELEQCNNVIEAFTYINLNVKMTYKWDDESPITREFQEVVKAKFLEG